MGPACRYPSIGLADGGGGCGDGGGGDDWGEQTTTAAVRASVVVDVDVDVGCRPSRLPPRRRRSPRRRARRPSFALPTATSAITGVRYRTATPTRRALEDMRRRRAEASERLRAMALLATLLAIALGLRLAGGAHGGGGGGGTRLNGGGGGGGATTTIIMGGGVMKGAAATQWTRRTRAISSSRLTSSSGAPMPTPSLARMRPHLFREIDLLTNYRRFRLPSS